MKNHNAKRKTVIPFLKRSLGKNKQKKEKESKKDKILF